MGAFVPAMFQVIAPAPDGQRVLGSKWELLPPIASSCSGLRAPLSRSCTKEPLDNPRYCLQSRCGDRTGWGVMRRALRLVRSAAPVAALLLSACGGGGGGGVNFVPAPPVTPSPTPSPPYDSFPLNKSASFDTIIAERWVDRSFAPNLNAFDVAARPSGFTISYDASSGSYTVNGEGFVQTFTDAERSSSGYFDTYTDPAHPDVHLTLLNNTRVDPSVSGAPVQLSYLSFGRETLDQTLDGGGAGWHWDTYFLFGYPTQTSDMPKTGTASYSTAAFASYTTLNKGDPITTVTGNATFS